MEQIPETLSGVFNTAMRNSRIDLFKSSRKYEKVCQCGQFYEQRPAIVVLCVFEEKIGAECASGFFLFFF